MGIREYIPREKSIYAIQFVRGMDEEALCAFTNDRVQNIREDVTFDGKLSAELTIHSGVSTYVFEGDYIYKDLTGLVSVMSEKNFTDKYEPKE